MRLPYLINSLMVHKHYFLPLAEVGNQLYNPLKVIMQFVLNVLRGSFNG